MSSPGAHSTTSIRLMATNHSTTINSTIRTEQDQKFNNLPVTDTNTMIRSNIQAFKKEIKTLFTFQPREWLNAFKPNPQYPLFVLGDIDAFVALFMNNLATLLAVILGLKLVFKDELVYGKIVPG